MLCSGQGELCRRREGEAGPERQVGSRHPEEAAQKVERRARYQTCVLGSFFAHGEKGRQKNN